MTTGQSGPADFSYAAAGVDIKAGEHAVDLMRKSVERTTRAGVLGSLGGFAGLFQLDLGRFPNPVLATSTDGVGTKLVIAQRLDKHDTVGIDLVAMVIDDLVVVGAEPLFMTDYIATGRVDPEKIATIVSGIAAGCVQAGCALIGGETAEHPGVMGSDDYDIAGSGVGVVNADRVLDSSLVRCGDVLIAMGSSGLHANGYSLVRQIIADTDLDSTTADLDGRSLGEELLVPTRIYAQDCLALIAQGGVSGLAHITGGGLASNLARVLPSHLDAVVHRDSWSPAGIFGFLARRGNLAQAELESAFNLGVGMVAIVSSDRADAHLELLRDRAVPCWILGSIQDGSGQVRMSGDYKNWTA